MQEVYLKNEGASQEEISEARRAQIAEIVSKFNQASNANEINFAEIEKSMLELQGELENKVGNQKLSKLASVKVEEAEAGADE